MHGQVFLRVISRKDQILAQIYTNKVCGRIDFFPYACVLNIIFHLIIYYGVDGDAYVVDVQRAPTNISPNVTLLKVH